MRKSLTALGLALLLFTGGCTGAPQPPNPDGPAVTAANTPVYPRDQVVLQLDHGGGFWMPDRASELVPEVTVWGDGQIVFVAPDGSIRAGRLPAETLGRLVGQATFLYDLAEHYDAVTHTDAASASFTVYTGRGRKTVQVYGLDPKPGPREGEPHPALFARLRDLWAKVHAALPADAPALAPTVVYVHTRYTEAESGPDWPADLKGRLAGAAARRAWELAGPGPAKSFLVEGRVQQVLVVPVLPRPHSWEDDPIGLPGQVSGRNDDGALAMEARASRQPDDSYKVTVTLSNKGQQGIDLLFNCGSLLWWEGLKQPAPNVDRACPDVYSQLLEPGQTHVIEATLPPGAVEDWRALAVAVRYPPDRTLQTFLRAPLP